MWREKDYLNSKQGLIDHVNEKGFSTHIVNAYAVDVGIPFTVAYKYIITDLPQYKRDCEDKLQELNIFYGIKEQ